LRLPRDVSGEELVRALRKLGYELTRQTESHMRVTSKASGKRASRHDSGTQAIEGGDAGADFSGRRANLELTREELAKELFGS
jgi:hypothetical protein